jgi:hypothetical protein
MVFNVITPRQAHSSDVAAPAVRNVPEEKPHAISLQDTNALINISTIQNIGTPHPLTAPCRSQSGSHQQRPSPGTAC